MLESLFLNVAIVMMVAYLASLTVSSPGRPPSNLEVIARLLISVFAGLVVMAFPAQVAPGVVFDLRNVPVVAITFVQGPVLGLLAALPIAAYRLHLGGPGALPAVLSLAAAVLTVTLARRYVHPYRSESWRYWWVVPLVFAVPPLFMLLLPNGWHLLARVYAPLVVASSAAFAIVVSVIRSRLRLLELTRDYDELAHRDALTGLANRRQFERDLARVTSRHHLLVMDLDRFKRVNDTLGHDAGDRVLRAVGAILQNAIRHAAGDRAYRLGGEEFAVILANCPVEAAWSVAERIRERMSPEVRRLAGLQDVTITVSGGLVLVGGGAPRERLAVADTLLYLSKRSGRDRISREHDLLPGRAELVHRTVIDETVNLRRPVN